MARCETFDSSDPWRYFNLTDPLDFEYTYETGAVYGGGASHVVETFRRTATQSGEWSGLSGTAKDSLVEWLKSNWIRSCCTVSVVYGGVVTSTDNFKNFAPSIKTSNDGCWFTVSATIDETDSLTKTVLDGTPTNPLSQTDIKNWLISAEPFTVTRPSFRAYFNGEHEDVETEE